MNTDARAVRSTRWSRRRHADHSAARSHLEHGRLVIRALLPEAERVHGHAGRSPNPSRWRGDARGMFEAQVPGVDPESRLPPARHISRRRTSSISTIRIAIGRVISEYDLYLFGEGKHTRIYEKLGAHVMRARTTCDGVHFAVWAPNAGGSASSATSTLGRPRAPDARARRERRLGDLHSRRRATGNATSSRSGRARRVAAQVRPVRLRLRGAAADGVDRQPVRITVARRRVDAPRESSAPGSTGRWRSTRCTSDRGRACPRTAIAT